MNDRLKELYKSVILSHHHNPVGFEIREDASQELEAYNPLCGDKFRLFFDINDGKISDIHFHGYGCAISKASTSVLVEMLKGKTLEEARELCAEFMQYVSPEAEPLEPRRENFEAFSAAREFPGRLKCATLSWDAMREFIGQTKQE
jgi:nitrogen fixation NifU-like protein